MLSTGYWIGHPKTGDSYQTRGVFFSLRHEINEKLSSCPINISAAVRYRLHVNGRAIHSGPQRSDGFWLHYDTIDIAPWLIEGENVIAVQVMQFAMRNGKNTDYLGPSWAIPGETDPWLLIWGQDWITTGIAPWQCAWDQSLGFELYHQIGNLGANEVVQGELYPHGWLQGKQEGFACAQNMHPNQKHQKAGALTPYPVEPRTIPLLLEETGPRLLPFPDAKGGAAFVFDANDEVTLEKGTYAMELDADVLRTGFVSLAMEGGKGSKVRIGYSECYVQPNKSRGRRDDRSGDFDGVFDTYFPGGGHEVYQPFLLRTFRYMRLEVTVGDAPLTLHMPSYSLCNYPMDIRAMVDSEFEWVNELWDISLQTLKDCTHETYEDCPYYEQLQYIMDTRLQVLFTFAVSSDTALARQAVETYHQALLPEGIILSRSPSRDHQIIPVFALHWIFMLSDLYIQTGDAALLARYQPTVDAVLNWFDRKRGPLGLCEHMGYWEFADWTKAWDEERGVPTAVESGPCTHHNLTYALALQTAAQLLEYQGLDNKRYVNRAESILAAVKEHCYDNEKAMFRDGPSCMEFTQHSQVFAVLTGLVSGQEARRLMERTISEDLIPCSFPLKFYLFRALEETELYDKTLELWDAWIDFLPLHVTTWPETPFNPRSECHAWGCLPLYEFVRCLMGIRPGAGGWSEIILRPMAGVIGEIDGQAPTPHGMVTVRIDELEDGAMEVSGQSPPGVPLRIQSASGEDLIIYPQGGPFQAILK